MNQDQIRDLLKFLLAKEGYESLSKRLGMSRQHIWNVVAGKYNAGGKMLEALGLQERTVIVRVPKSTSIRSNPRLKAVDREVYRRKAWWAQQKTNRAVKAGRLPNLKDHWVKCADCSNRATTYDHRDYSKPLDVSAVCSGCNLRRGPAVVGSDIQPRVEQRNGQAS